jgi:predicted transposase YbfD/YdcC
MKPKQSQKAMGHLEVPWDVNVLDPRDARGRRHAHHGLLNALVLGLASGLRTLRAMEGLVEDASPLARRRLGLPRSVSDSTLYRMLAAQNTEGFRETVWNQLDELWTRGLVSNDLVPGGVVAFDGKGAWSSTSTEVAGAKVSSCDADGKPLWLLGSLRAVLTSSSAQPCLDMQLIADKDAESPSFRTVFSRLCGSFGRRFRLVTGDAAFACRENAELVRDAGKHYLFSVKGNQPTLLALAQAWLQHWPCELRTEERASGKVVTRELTRISFAEDDDAALFQGARQLWLNRQTTLIPGSQPTVDDRYFVTSLPVEDVTAQSALALIRLHWGIENGHNWTMDCILEEDDSQPCQQSRDAIEVLTWLRILALNIVSAWRARLPLKDGLPQPWRRVMQRLRDDAVLFGVIEPIVQPA